MFQSGMSAVRTTGRKFNSLFRAPALQSGAILVVVQRR